MSYSEETLVQTTTANYLHDELEWESIYAYNQEDYGENSLLGRENRKQIILTRYLERKLRELNPNHPDEAYQEAIRTLTDYSVSQSLFKINQEKHNLLRDGIQVSYRNKKGETVKPILNVFDFETPTNNHFLAVRELWIEGKLYLRRADLVCFVNGIPLIFMELKNIWRSLRAAYEENYLDYLDTIPQLFYYNAIVVFGNGYDAKMGTIGSRFEYFQDWKRLQESDAGVVNMETLLKGVCNKNNLLDLFENFILFDDSSQETVKIIARNHQYLGVNNAIEAVKNRQTLEGKLGVFWHTQGSGKSYSMVFFVRKVRRKLGGNFSFVVCTDREDLDNQIYNTFAGCGLANNDRDPCRATSSNNLKQLLQERKACIFTLIQKFNQAVDPSDPYNERDDIIIISDEAHRSQYGNLALNQRNALPNASFIGFTGTPLFQNDEITSRYFGYYVSTYDFQRAVEDNATVPLYYDARGDKLEIATNDVNERIAEKLEALEVEGDVERRIQQALKSSYGVITAEPRLDAIAQDFVKHYANGWEMGKAMFVCIDKITCVRMYEKITHYWQEEINRLQQQLNSITDQQEAIYKQRQIEWMEETIASVVVSQDQGEVQKFREWGLEEELNFHRNRINNGFELTDGKRISLETAFKDANHPFRIAIVCAMWLTGFDVPCLSTLYLDKPLKAHTLMQAIARANRVYEGKNNGLIVDYCGILQNLREALATFAGTGDEGREEDDQRVNPAKSQEHLLEELQSAIDEVREFLRDRNASLDAILEETGFARNAAIITAKEAINEDSETRKRFRILCRQVFRKFTASTNITGINDYRKVYDAIKLLDKELETDEKVTDINQVLRELYQTVGETIEVRNTNTEDGELYDISQINFERLKEEFRKSSQPRTTVQNLKQAVENRLSQMINRNSSRVDYQRRYEEIIDRYNQEKDRLTIEQTFEELFNFIQDLNEEEQRSTREGLSEEALAIFDLLKKPNLEQSELKQIKQVASNLLQLLKEEISQLDQWYEKESTRDRINGKIYDFLYNEETGLPVESYEEEDIADKTKVIFLHAMQVYKTVPSPCYQDAA